MPAIAFASMKLAANVMSSSVFRTTSSATASEKDFRTLSSVVAKAAASRVFSASYSASSFAMDTSALEVASSPSSTTCEPKATPCMAFVSSASTADRCVVAAKIATRGCSGPDFISGGQSCPLRLSYSWANFRMRSTFLMPVEREEAPSTAQDSIASQIFSMRSANAGSSSMSVGHTEARASKACTTVPRARLVSSSSSVSFATSSSRTVICFSAVTLALPVSSCWTSAPPAGSGSPSKLARTSSKRCANVLMLSAAAGLPMFFRKSCNTLLCTLLKVPTTSRAASLR
mmetsp:Transcript_2290/g.6409  ORF Transcript_2290/g.6409 Transcript_2290/m.6409 type:complete len:288 (-) Transcript_2290:903-1766(-)